MVAAAGWYPDPSGAAQLRYWDGSSWTSATAERGAPAAPAAQPASSLQGFYATTPQAWTQTLTPARVATQDHPRSRKTLYGIIAGVVVAASAAVAVALIAGDGHGAKAPTAANLSKVLLNAAEVSQAADGNFVAQPSSNDGDSNSKADCDDKVDPLPGAEKADISREFAATGQVASEDLSYTAGADALFSSLKQKMAACHTLSVDGETLGLEMLPAPTVTGSDDSLAMQASGLVAGQPLVIDVVLARYGNGVVAITYGAREIAALVSVDANTLLQKAATKAKPAF